mgnify:CR=1 FL=1
MDQNGPLINFKSKDGRIFRNGDHKKPDEISGEINYIDKLGTGYGWILILIGMAIFAILFYVYFV